MEKPFILIIEDERDIAALFRHVMDLAGYRTEIVSNGVTALERLANTTPDVVLLDLSLPGIPGAEVLARMHNTPALKSIPVVVITAFAEMAESLQVEPDLIMLKPVSATQLTSLVQRLAHDSRRLETAPFGNTPWDEVTGLYNRAFFMHRVDSALKNLQQNGQNPFAILALSPGRYKAINEEQGQKKADDFAHVLAAGLRACVRPTDTIARFDADRFFLLIEQAPGLHIPEMIAARILSKLNTGQLTCNVAVLRCDTRYHSVDEVISDSIAAFELAQAAGPASCLTFDYDSIRSHSSPT